MTTNQQRKHDIATFGSCFVLHCKHPRYTRQWTVHEDHQHPPKNELCPCIRVRGISSTAQRACRQEVCCSHSLKAVSQQTTADLLSRADGQKHPHARQCITNTPLLQQVPQLNCSFKAIMKQSPCSPPPHEWTETVHWTGSVRQSLATRLQPACPRSQGDLPPAQMYSKQQ